MIQTPFPTPPAIQSCPNDTHCYNASKNHGVLCDHFGILFITIQNLYHGGSRLDYCVLIVNMETCIDAKFS